MLEKIRSTLLQYHHTLTLAILELLIGIFMLVSPAGMAVGILWVSGALLLADGVVRSIAFFKESPEEGAKSHKLASGIFFIIAGLFFLFRYSFVVNIFPVLAALFGLIAMVLVFLKIEWVVNCLREKNIAWYLAGCSLLFTFFAMLILYTSLVPFTAAGIMLIISAAIDALFFFNKKGKITVPSFGELIRAFLGLFSRKSARTDESDVRTNETPVVPEQPVPQPAAYEPQPAPVPQGPSTAPEAQPFSVPSTEAASPAEPDEKEGNDPADEDRSWANVPQLNMP